MKEKIRKKIKLSIIIWVGLYPTLLLVLNVLEPYIYKYSSTLQTLIVTLIVVPSMQFFIVPCVKKIFSYFGVDVE